MKKKLLIASTVMALVVASFSLGAYAAVKYSLVINGKSVKADIKVINGTPYIPITALSGNLKGVTTKVDSKTGIIKIDEPKPATTPPPASPGLSRSNPASVGSTVTFGKKDYSDDYQVTLKVEAVIRGAEAWKLIQEANQFNDEPEAGYEYVLAKINAGVSKNAKGDSQVLISKYDFTLVSSSGKDYVRRATVLPDPELDAKLYVGASDSGWVSFQVKTDDANPLIAFGRSYDGKGGAWFKIN
ncbi:DUF4352 domain-containing protein [Cohnella soli]|uniref:DUF4352 domain-containing protein n=1 Tax=Cohnella soli TaxID=425005 RepID=A0ABW0HJD2_9BACL